MNVRLIGAPNSIARYCANTDFGENEWAVFEYVNGSPVVRAAGTKAHCESFVTIDRLLINVASYKPETVDAWNSSLYEPHTHVNNGVDDTCKMCGADIRHPIHLRITK